MKLITLAFLVLTGANSLVGQTIKYQVAACATDSRFDKFGEPQDKEFKGKYDKMTDTTVVELRSETSSSLIANTERKLLLGMRFSSKALSQTPELFFQSQWKVSGGDNVLLTKDLTAQSKLDENQTLMILVDDSLRLSLPAVSQGRRQSTNILSGHNMTENSYFGISPDQIMQLLTGKAINLRTGGHLFKWSGESLKQAKDIYRSVLCGQQQTAKVGG